MTERTRGLQPSGSPQEAIDLNELHASKTQEHLRASVVDPVHTDLSSASIQSMSVVRLSARPAMRKITSHSPEPRSDQKPRKQPILRSHQKYGVFKNPYFPYEGGPLGRLISLLANLIKVGELAIFNTPRHTPPPSHAVQSRVVKAKKRDASGRELEEEEEEKEELRELLAKEPPRPELE
jgi:hypothetical protein